MTTTTLASRSSHRPSGLAAVLRTRLRNGSGLAVTEGVRELSYADLVSLTDQMAGRLRALGLRAGDRVGLLGINSVEWVTAFLACLDLGVIAAPLNYRLSSAELRGQLAALCPRLVLADGDLLDSVVGQSQTPVRALAGAATDERSINSVTAIRHDPVDSPADAPALISFTSGSTGPPKGAVITQAALVLAARAYVQVLQTTDQDRTLVLGPLFHNTGFCDQLAHMILVGGTVDLLPTFSTASASAALLKRPASYLIAVPGILRLLATATDADALLGSCRIACYGGSPMPPAWIDDLRASWPDLRLHNCYGLTEFTSVSHILEPVDLADHHDSVGRPVAGVEQRIVDRQNRRLAPGQPGRLLLAGPTRMAGYWREPELTRSVFTGRWLITEDLAAIDDGGFLRVLGRASDVINRGGEKISPLQVESALAQEELVTEAAVVAAPHPIFGQRVVAFVTTTNRAELDVEGTLGRLRRQVADYAVPEHFYVIDELPRNAAGKVDRHQLRRCAEAAVECECRP